MRASVESVELEHVATRPDASGLGQREYLVRP